MSVVVTLPQLGESVVEGTVARWLVKEGDRVERDQPLVEVTTDKVDAEILQPEAIAPDELAAWAAAVSSRVEALACLLRKDLDALAPAGRATPGAFLERVDGLVARLSALGEPVHAVKARLHGDLHLGQVLVVGSDVTFVGFGFEPTGVPEARRAKHSPMKDVTSLLLSLDRAASSAILRRAAERPEERPVLTSLVRAWQVDSEAALLTGYREGIGDCPTWPSGPAEASQRR